MGSIAGGYPLRIAWDNEVDNFTTIIEASSAHVDRPTGNLKSQQITKVWRSLTVEQTLTIDFTFLTAKDISLFCARNHNLTSAAAITLVGATNSDFSPVAVTLGITQAANILVGEFGSTQSYQYWRLSIFDANNSDRYVEIGHVFLGEYDEFSFPDFATVISTVDPTISRVSYGGSATYFPQTKFRVVDFGLDMVQQTDRRVLETIYSSVGTGLGFYLFLDPENNRDNENAATGLDGKHRFTIFGTFTGNFTINHAAIDWHSINTLVVQELR